MSVLSSTFTCLMTKMTFSFSAILVVLTTYSSQFSPRTINNFLTNTSAKHTLGLFIMTTVYGISNLFLVRTADEGVVLSSGISALLVVGSIWAFVKFIPTDPACRTCDQKSLHHSFTHLKKMTLRCIINDNT